MAESNASTSSKGDLQMPALKIEHVALNVVDPAAIAAWYVQHLGMRVVRESAIPPYIHFVADAAGRTVIELYSNPVDSIPDYASMHPLRLHVAFATDDPEGSRTELVAGGASVVDDLTREDGTRLIMLRDPWGLAIQLCKRPQPLL
jgi:glyoxylase I family protein